MPRKRSRVRLLPKPDKDQVGKQSLVEAAERAASALTFLGLSNQFISPRRGTQELLQMYSQSPWLRAIVGKVARAVADIDWFLLAQKGPNGRYIVPDFAHIKDSSVFDKAISDATQLDDVEIIINHPLLGMFRRGTGNPRLMGHGVFLITQAHLDLTGEAFWLLERDNLGTPFAMWPMPPNWVKSFPTQTHPFYQVTVENGFTMDVPFTEFIPFIDPDPKNPYRRGTGVAGALADEIEIDEFSAKHQKSFFLNRARPDLIISGQHISPSDTDRLEQQWLAEHQGFWKAFKPLFFSNQIDVKELSQTFESMQMVQIRRNERDTFISVFGAPPEKLGVIGESKRCHTDDTEVLTRRGWKRFRDISKGDCVATWYEDKKSIRYKKPLNIFCYDHDGDIHHWHGASFDVAVTPNHRMFCSGYGSTYGNERYGRDDNPYFLPYKFLTSEEMSTRKSGYRWRATGGGVLAKKDKIKIPYMEPLHVNEKSPIPKNNRYWEYDADIFASFLGYWISEGSLASSYKAVRLHQNESDLSDEMQESMIVLGMGSVRTYKQLRDTGKVADEHTLLCRSLFVWLQENVGHKATNKRLPQEIFYWPETAKVILLRSLMDGDGHWGKGSDRLNKVYKNSSYVTASEGLADDVQRLAFEIGLRARKVKIEDKDRWHISISSLKEYSVVPKRNLDVIPYKGKVWCLEVPSGVFVTRRNGCVSIHGNSTIAAADFFWNKDVIKPRVEAIRRTLQQTLVPMFDERLVLAYHSPVVQDQEHTFKVMDRSAWGYTLNEWRHEAKKPSLGPAGEMIVLPLNMRLVRVRDEEGNPVSQDEMLASNIQTGAESQGQASASLDTMQITSDLSRELTTLIAESLDEIKRAIRERR